MATGITSISFDRRSPQSIGRGRGLKVITGQLVLSTTTEFITSGIEKMFRRCHDIHVNCTSGSLVQWQRSATHKYGKLYTYAVSGTSTTSSFLRTKSFADMTSAFFTAFGI